MNLETKMIWRQVQNGLNLDRIILMIQSRENALENPKFGPFWAHFAQFRARIFLSKIRLPHIIVITERSCGELVPRSKSFIFKPEGC